MGYCFTKSNLMHVTFSLRWGIHYAEKYQFQSHLPPQCNRSDCFNKNGDDTRLLKTTTGMKKAPAGKLIALKFAHLIYSLRKFAEIVN